MPTPERVLDAHGVPRPPERPPQPSEQQLPELPRGIPEAPSVAGFDVGALLQPMTDLLSTFGTGGFPGLDPSAALSAASQALQQAGGAAAQAVGALGSLWQGPAATAATGKGLQAAAGTGQVAEQGAQISAAVSEAAAAVAEGEAELVAIIDSFLAVVDATAPILWLPPGQAIVVSAAQEHLDHALEVVSRTKVELSELSGQVSAAGAKVPVGAPPMAGALSAVTAVLPAVIGVATSVASGAAQFVGQGVSGAAATGTKAAQAAGAIAGKLVEQATKQQTDAAGRGTGAVGTALGGFPVGGAGAGAVAGRAGGGGVPSGGAGLGASGVGIAPGLLAPGTAQPPVSAPRAPVIEGGARTVVAGDAVRAPMGSVLPLGAAGLAGARAAAGGAHQLPDYLVTTDNGEQVVGDGVPVGPRVLGADETEPEDLDGAADPAEIRLRW